ncbi:M48 family metalloprotease [Pseudoroseomonas ludipueritiae]|uniref:M48 family metalloprotease n=1 Tax=Pseudoroseomonas ludipueritiae TaxID=198093 RepID=A0ABR7R342_9PROT|nr:M48 family metalloprotease [Pseudoroseomonas ludipueritiae]MBC9176148.1 M48 family metalloprotease [Pseudoroseomonas ludipueritiae]
MLDLDRVPGTGAFLYVAFLLTITLVIAQVGFLLADRVFSAGLPSSQATSLLLVLLVWAMTWLRAWHREGVDRGAMPASSDRQRLVEQRVSEIAARLLIKPPHVRFVKTFENRSAWVCGLFGRPTIVIENVFARFVDTPVFDGTIVHELSHVANGDARWKALSDAMAYWLTAILGLTFGIQAIRFLVDLQGEWPAVSVMAFGAAGWVHFRLLQAATDYLLPVAIPLILFRLSYAHLSRSREVAADWRALAAGYGEALAAVARGTARPVSMLDWLQAPFKIAPQPGRRAALLKAPERMCQSPLGDYVIAGGMFLLVSLAREDLKILQVDGVEAGLTFEFLSQLFLADPFIFLLLGITSIVWPIYAGLLVLRDFLVFWKRPWAGCLRVVQAVVCFELGMVLASAGWIGNLSEPGFLMLTGDFTLLDAISSRYAATLLVSAASVVVLCLVGLLWRWRVSRCGLRKGWLQTAEAVLLVYFAQNLLSVVAFVQYGDAMHDDETGRLVVVLAAVAALLVVVAVVGVAAFVRHPGRSAIIDVPDAPSRISSVPPPLALVGVRHKADFRRLMGSGGAVMLLSAACYWSYVEMDRRVIVLEAAGATERNDGAAKRIGELKQALEDRLSRANTVWTQPVVLAATGDGSRRVEWLGLLGRLLDRRSAPRRFTVRVGLPAAGQTAPQFGIPNVLEVDLPSDATGQAIQAAASSILSRTFPYLQFVSEKQAGVPERELRLLGERLLSGWPEGDTSAYNINYELGVIGEHQEDRVAAFNGYNRAFLARVGFSAARAGLAREYLRRGKADEAIQHFGAVLRERPYDEFSWFDMALAFRVKWKAETDAGRRAAIRTQVCHYVFAGQRLSAAFDQISYAGSGDDDPRILCKQDSRGSFGE